jgi:hypothetical protein
MGELALVLDRGSCTFTGGMLEIATVGFAGTPAWAYTKVAQHRELATIRTVRPGWRASEQGYVAFLDALPRLPPRVRLLASMIQPLAVTRPVWPVRVLELVTDIPELPIAIAAAALPEVEAIELLIHDETPHVRAATVRALLEAFPRLARVHVDAAGLLPDDIRDELGELARLDPRVTVSHGGFR